MNDERSVSDGRVEPSGSARPAWWVVLRRALPELWVAGRALNLLILFSILMGITSFLLATNSELSLIPPKEMVFLTLQASIAFGIFIGMIIGADSFSGERERGTLEAVLLTPTSRRQIVVGKFLAALSSWPAALAISLPALVVVSQGDEVLGQGLLWGVLLGSLLALAFTGFGTLVSIWSNSNKNSMFVCLVVWLLLFLPTQLPGEAQEGSIGDFVQMVNPMEATNVFLENILVNNRSVADQSEFLVFPFVAPALVLLLLFSFASPGLRLEAGRAGRNRRRWGRVAGLLVTAGLMMFLRISSAIGQEEPSADPALPLQISIDMDHAVVKTGDKVEFDTLVTNSGTEESPPLIVALNIIGLAAEGDVVDPEDWSPERTQYIEPLAPGGSADHSWRINAILKGNYMVYMIVVPQPDGLKATSQPVSSSGIHLTVNPFARLNPKGVLPVAIFVPLGLTLGVLLLFRLRLRRIAELDQPQ